MLFKLTRVFKFGGGRVRSGFNQVSRSYWQSDSSTWIRQHVLIIFFNAFLTSSEGRIHGWTCLACSVSEIREGGNYTSLCANFICGADIGRGEIYSRLLSLHMSITITQSLSRFPGLIDGAFAVTRPLF